MTEDQKHEVEILFCTWVVLRTQMGEIHDQDPIFVTRVVRENGERLLKKGMVPDDFREKVLDRLLGEYDSK